MLADFSGNGCELVTQEKHLEFSKIIVNGILHDMTTPGPLVYCMGVDSGDPG